MSAGVGQPVNLSNSAGAYGSCSWTADGLSVLFVSGGGGQTEIYPMQADGARRTG